MTQWYEDDAFWRDNYLVMFSEEAFRRATEDVTRILSLTGVESGSRVLDLCCGPGRHSVPLALAGFDVTSVDLSPFLLERARENARARDVAPEFVHADMRRFVRPQAFDLILNLYTSFGYFADRSDDARVLSNMFESLRPGGQVIVDVIGKELQSRRGDRVTDLADGTTCIQRIRPVDNWSALQVEWIVIRGDAVRRYHFRHRLYSGVELQDLMEDAGLEVSLFGDLSGTSYDESASRLIALGRKV
jgi:SAM-dependent methyltransferase